MQAIILAGGKGTRLQPYTLIFPKPMLPVGEMPIIEIIIKQLYYYGFKDLIISLGHLGHYIEMYFNNKSNVPIGTNISYINETKPLGTAGPIALVEELEENFLVINGDILTTIDYSDFLSFHLKNKSILSIAVGIKKIQIDLGVLELDDNLQIKSFVEKPSYNYSDNMGIYIYNKRVLNYIDKNENISVNTLVMKLIKNNEKVHGYISNEPYYWIDIGKHGDYENANSDFKRRKKDFLRED